MGKAIIIKGADFSSVAVAHITTHYNGIGVVDLTQYENLHFAITSPIGQNPYECISASGADCYTVPVMPGEKYKLKYCCGALSCVAIGLNSDTIEESDRHLITNVVADILIVNGTSGQTYYDDDYEFYIPDGVESIVISGRNSTNPNFVVGYALELTRLE